MPRQPHPAPQGRCAQRQRLLDAATELFATRGLHVTLNDIAHHAGVGVGTADRRFANKDELIDALFEVQLDVIAQMAAEALKDPGAWNAAEARTPATLTMSVFGTSIFWWSLGESNP